MEKKDEYKMYILMQLDNVLRGDALRVLEDNKADPKDKKIHMDVIEALKQYLNDYEKNMELIRQAEKYNKQMEDDLSEVSRKN